MIIASEWATKNRLVFDRTIKSMLGCANVSRNQITTRMTFSHCGRPSLPLTPIQLRTIDNTSRRIGAKGAGWIEGSRNSLNCIYFSGTAFLKLRVMTVTKGRYSDLQSSSRPGVRSIRRSRNMDCRGACLCRVGVFRLPNCVLGRPSLGSRHASGTAQRHFPYRRQNGNRCPHGQPEAA